MYQFQYLSIAQLSIKFIAKYDSLIEYRFEEQALTVDICRQVLSILEASKVTFYDAAHHAVALTRSATFLTADEVYVRKTAQIGHIMI
jgi:predicted nucleic acid-binding protein